MFLSHVKKSRRENLENVFHFPLLFLAWFLPSSGLWMLMFSSFLIILWFNSALSSSVCSTVLLLCTLCAAVSPMLLFLLWCSLCCSSSLCFFVLSLQCLSPIHLSHFLIIVLTFLRCFSVSQDDTFGRKKTTGGSLFKYSGKIIPGIKYNAQSSCSSN